MKQLFPIILALILSLSLIIPDSAYSKNILRKRYVLYLGDWNSDPGTSQLLGIMGRAKQAGYNGFVLNIWNYYMDGGSNMDKVKAEGQKLGLALIPFAFGQAEATYMDINLSEAFPVKDTKYFVGGDGTATVPGKELIANPGFETYTGNTPANWKVPGAFCTIDNTVKHSGGASILIQNGLGQIKIQTGIQVKTFKAYRLSVWLKTENFSASYSRMYTRYPQIEVNGGGRGLFRLRTGGMPGLWGEPPAATQNWTQYTLDFNALECNSTATVTFTITDEQTTGKIWIDDFSIQEVGLYETIRRPSCPVVVKSADGLKTYSENKDYTIEIPAPRRTCCFIDIQNNQGTLRIPGGSSIKTGDSLNVSWFQFGNCGENSATAASGCSPAFEDSLKSRISVISTKMLTSPPGFMMAYDEWYSAFWDPACKQSPYNYQTAGEYMGGTAKVTERLFRKVNPQLVDVYAWNDMFDPTNYASMQPPAWLINGSLAGGWNYITPSICIMNWSYDVKSFAFWGGKDARYPIPEHRQIFAGYYDGTGSASTECRILDSLDKIGVGNVVGYMYTTWQGKYDDIENEANIYKAAGRWGNEVSPFDASDIAAIKDSVVKKPGLAPIPQVIPINSDLKILYSPLDANRTIQFSVDQKQRVVLLVTNIAGQIVETLLNEDLTAGIHKVNWGASKKRYSGGIYFLRLISTEKNSKVEKQLPRKTVVF